MKYTISTFIGLSCPYIETTVENVTNQNIDSIHHIVERVKHRREVGINYMKSWEIERMHHEEGREEGLAEGIIAFIKTAQDWHASKEDTLAKILQNFKLNQNIAESYIEKYWTE